MPVGRCARSSTWRSASRRRPRWPGGLSPKRSIPAGSYDSCLSLVVLRFWLFKSLDEITGGLPLSIFFQHERDGFNRGFLVGEGSFKLHDDILPIRCA